MNTFSDMLRFLRLRDGYSQSELANKLGVSKSSISMYERGSRQPDFELEEALADLFNVSLDFLRGKSDNSSKTSNGVTVNVLGRVAAGIPINAISEIIDSEEITETMARTGEFFGLKIKGDSMEPRIYDGDVVIVRQQEDAESGDIVIAMVNGDDAVCKRLVKYASSIALVSLNSKYEPMMFTNDEIEAKPVRIIGKVVELRGKL